LHLNWDSQAAPTCRNHCCLSVTFQDKKRQ